MKLKFKLQPYQSNAVKSVVDCFEGQVSYDTQYRIDPGVSKKSLTQVSESHSLGMQLTGFKNADIQLNDRQLIESIKAVQQRQNLSLSDKLETSAGCNVNLDVEMETGTGKTYCYIKTIFEMNKCYGWTKFVIVVPSIAIREGVLKSLEITTEHFAESYGKKARFFSYNSRQLYNLENFSSDAGINVMVINIQAFNATGKDNRRIYEELDEFQSRRPIDVIRSNRPILILDEPQRMEGTKTLKALEKFKPLMILRYSATHRVSRNKIHRLDALDAYNQKLVKKIAVSGISVKGHPDAEAYLYLESIEISKATPVARVEMKVRQKSGVKRITKRLKKGRNLFDESKGLEQYRGFVVSDIDGRDDTVEFTNGVTLQVGDVAGDHTETTIRQIQIREAIKAHFEKEQRLFSQGIKVLSLFFIDEVAKYRDYSQEDKKGEYARLFEEEYKRLKGDYLMELALGNKDYRKYLSRTDPGSVHNGYFSIDKKTNRLTNPRAKKRGEEAGLSDDVDAYDLILKEKERLLSFEEPIRFIFSHSALREGWDNPNVFVICMLKHSSNTISRHQEVGRGLRLSVNKHGDRMDHPANVHDLNILTVVASESYKDFVTNLQREISDSLSGRPRKADVAYFTGKRITTKDETLEVTKSMSTQICGYLMMNSYADNTGEITNTYHEAKANDILAKFPLELEPYAEQIFGLIDNVFNESQLPVVGDERRSKANPPNANIHKKEFKELWKRINKKAVYCVEFDSKELILKSTKALNKELQVTPLQYSVRKGIQENQITYAQVDTGNSFKHESTKMEPPSAPIHSTVRYDLLGKITENTQLTRKTIARILSGINPGVFGKFKKNPEHFIAEVSRLINEQKATIIIERLSYDSINESYDMNIFTTGQSKLNFSKNSEKLKKHICDYVNTDSKIERNFVKELDVSAEVVVYTKLPRGFLIPTPVGDYNPDWAISFKEGTVKHIHFVAETKGSMSTMELRHIEEKKIECARRFFEKISQKVDQGRVKYDVVTDYEKLMDIVGKEAAPQCP